MWHWRAGSPAGQPRWGARLAREFAEALALHIAISLRLTVELVFIS